MNLDHIREGVAVLQDDIAHLEGLLRGLDPDSPEAESKERVLNVKWRLLTDQRAMLERAGARSAREAAEDRWRWHEANDTLDLY